MHIVDDKNLVIIAIQALTLTNNLMSRSLKEILKMVEEKPLLASEVLPECQRLLLWGICCVLWGKDFGLK